MITTRTTILITRAIMAVVFSPDDFSRAVTKMAKTKMFRLELVSNDQCGQKKKKTGIHEARSKSWSFVNSTKTSIQV